MPGTGDIWSTAPDLARFTTALHSGQLLTDGSLRLLRTPHAPVGADDGSGDGWLTSDGYGYGQFVGTIAGQTAYFHPGDNPGYQSFGAWIPAHAACVVILANEETTSIEGLLKQLL
jgi:CubicO group peptidase (beta-lactamase class C family)